MCCNYATLFISSQVQEEDEDDDVPRKDEL